MTTPKQRLESLLGPTTDVDRTRWLLQNAATLHDLLTSDLPRGLRPLAWTVSPYGLIGTLHEHREDYASEQRREDFARWVHALDATPSSTPAPAPGHAEILWGVRERYGKHRVRVTLRTDVFDEQDGGRS